MATKNLEPLLSLLQTCKTFDQLKQIQAQSILTGLISDPYLSSRLIAFCTTSTPPNLHHSTQILHNAHTPNIFSYNLTIKAFSDSPSPHQSILLYKKLMECDTETKPDTYTYPYVLKACGHIGAIGLGLQVFGHVVKFGYESNVYVGNGVMSMMVGCGDMDGAAKVFEGSSVRDLVSWNTIINGYVKSGRGEEGLRVWGEMAAAGVEADEVTMIGAVSACGQVGDLRRGRELHRYVEENGVKLTLQLCNALMDMYVKCGSLEEAEVLFENMNNKRSMVSWTTMIVGYAKFGLLEKAREVFDEMPERDFVAWNALISGYVQAERCKDALALFHEMQGMNIEPNEFTMVSLLSACSQLGALNMGEWIHRYIDGHAIFVNVNLGTALVDMYAKCGNITKAVQVFRELPRRNSLTWTVMINALALHGHATDAISYFHEMTRIGLVPDEVTFIGVLSACCHAGFVEEGRRFFVDMCSSYDISPKLKHYSCMVDLLGKAGLLEEAEQLVYSMPMAPDTVILGALFFACRNHGDVAIGERVAGKLLELDPHDAGNYVQLANMFLEANMREKAEKVWAVMRERGLAKTPGCSSIEVNGIVYEFVARDKSHPNSEEIYACLMHLLKQLKLVGYAS